VVGSVSEEVQKIHEVTVKKFWLEWNEALQTSEPEKIVELYHESSALLPTLSNKVRPDRESKINYFEHFMQKKPVGTIKQDFVNINSPNLATYNGIYTFDLTAIGKSVDARFTYVYTYEYGAWKIKTHHSSLMPEAPKRRNLREHKNQHKELKVTKLEEEIGAGKAILSDDDVRALWNRWNAALATLSPETVAEQYWNRGSILLPTLSNQNRDTPETKANYFEHFLKKKPVGAIDQEFIYISENAAQYDGIYTFTLTNPDTGAVSTAQARFTYVFTSYPDSVGAKGEWRIETHHSSLMPNAGGLNGDKLIENFDRPHITEDMKDLEFSIGKF